MSAANAAVKPTWTWAAKRGMDAAQPSRMKRHKDVAELRLNYMAYAQSRFARLFSGKNFLVLLLVAIAFWQLHSYRQNDPLPVFSPAPDIQLLTEDNTAFRLKQINMPVVLVFYSERSFGANNIYPTVYAREMPYLKFLTEDRLAQVIVVIKGIDTPEKLREFTAQPKYQFLKNIAFALPDQEMARAYGVRSWPHVFILDRSQRIRYSAKIMAAETISRTVGDL
ncbi:MAG: peroxiredoxin family protein [Deferribacteraceae bacterium]|nr:peroxiredoxin family protein [Deferribacteraceae bacterium]